MAQLCEYQYVLRKWSTSSLSVYGTSTGDYTVLKTPGVSHFSEPEHERCSPSFTVTGVHCIFSVAKYHRTASQTTLHLLDAKPDFKRGNHSNSLHHFKHYPLVLKEHTITKSLSESTDVKELLTAWADAVLAHSEAYEKTHMLHGDINIGNIMINHNGRGVLIDWDLSNDRNPMVIDSPLKLTGTWHFTADRLLRSPDDKTEPIPVYNKDDDLESFWHVLHWLALRNCEPSSGGHHVPWFLEHAYNNSLDGWSACPPRQSLLTVFRLKDRVKEHPELPDYSMKVLEEALVVIELGWERRILFSIISPSESGAATDWTTGSRNTRRKDFEPPMVLGSLNKRKQGYDSEHGGSDADDNRNLCNKKART